MKATQTQTKKSKSGPSDPVAGQALAQALKYLQNQWKWSGADLGSVLHIPASTINHWLARMCVPVTKPYSPDLRAIIALLAIHKDLQAMFEKSEYQRKWLETEHPDMGIEPVNKMSESLEGLIGVRQYLDYARGRGA